ncbi:MAG: hypothetical protein KDH96_02865 [Candidatus Riesia sp.]|nr:hypothetical protein [Candidatus Riesia sp.]
MKINIDYRSNIHIEKVLSNLQPCKFLFLDQYCNSVEGVLQSLKFNDIDKQKSIIKLSGFPAKQAGKNIPYSMLNWFGLQFNRHSQIYQDFLNELLYCSISQCEIRKNALLCSKDFVLKHDLGCDDASKTILTRTEFITNLNEIRFNLLKEQEQLPDWLT